MELRKIAADRASRPDLRVRITSNLPPYLIDKSDRGWRTRIVDGQRRHEILAARDTIEGSSEEIQKSVIAKQVLGL